MIKRVRVLEHVLVFMVWCTFPLLPGPALYISWRFEIGLTMLWVSVPCGLLVLVYAGFLLLQGWCRKVVLVRKDKFDLWLMVILGLIPPLFCAALYIYSAYYVLFRP